jgi:hypothetical protein
MKRIEAALKSAQGWPDDKNSELGLAVRIAFECTDHSENRHELLIEAVFEKLAQDLGEAAAREIFLDFAEVDHGPRP